MKKIGKVVANVSYLILLAGIIVLFGGHWGIMLICLVVGGIMSVIAYQLVGGAENPEIYAEFNLPGLVAYAVKSANARIGFHPLRSQEEF